jgi:DNA polymerase-3 subunit delta
MSTEAKEKKALKPAYVITGSDEPKVEKAVRRLKERIISDAGTDINIDVFDATEQTALEVIQAACTLPFGVGQRLVLVTNAGNWSKADKDAIISYLGEPPEHTVLALTGRGFKKKEALLAAVAAVGEVLTFDAPRPSSLPRWVQEQARRMHLKLGLEEARRLILLTGSEQRAILSELEKLSTYIGKGTVGLDDMERLCWISPKVRIWDLTDALGARDRAAVFKHLEAVLREHTAPTMIFYAVARHLRMLSQVVEAKERGEEPARAALALGLKPYPAKKIAQQSRNFTVAGLKRTISILSDLDADMKGRDDLRPDLALELALARILDAVQ